MITKNKYIVLNADLIANHVIKDKDKWYDSIVDFIYEQINNKKHFLFEPNPTEHSIIFDLGEHEAIKINSKKCLVSKGVSLSKENLKEIVFEEDFYLGHIAIVVNDFDNNKLIDLTNFWDNELFKSGLELFKMDSDGLSFYWYNPTSESFESDFNKVS